MLDVNAGVTSVNPNETEPGLLVQTLEIVQGLVDLPLSIDSSVTAAIEAGTQGRQGPPAGQLRHRRGRRASGASPAAGQEIQCARSSPSPTTRPAFRWIRTCALPSPRRSSQRCADFGIPAHDVVVDPLVMPIGALGDAGRQVFALLRRLREELKRQHHLRRCPTSPSACRIAMASTPPSSRW